MNTGPSLERSGIGFTIGDANDHFEQEADGFAELRQQPPTTGPRVTSGYDFSGVRVHTDSLAAESARSVDANAFTVAHHIVSGEGRYSPATSRGRKLIAHELVHTIQQGANSAGQTSPIMREQASGSSRPPINLFPPNLVPPPPVTPRPSRRLEMLPGLPGTAALQDCSATAGAPRSGQPARLPPMLQHSTRQMGVDWAA